MIKKIHIYDIDGVLVDSSHRYKIDETGKIDLDHWRENRIHCDKDSLLPLASQYKKELNDFSYFVIVATARCFHPFEWRFFHKYIGMPDHIIHRKENDNRSGTELKLAGLRKILNLKQFRDIPKYYFEDCKEFLYPICEKLNINPVYVKSNQGDWK